MPGTNCASLDSITTTRGFASSDVMGVDLQDCPWVVDTLEEGIEIQILAGARLNRLRLMWLMWQKRSVTSSARPRSVRNAFQDKGGAAARVFPVGKCN